MASDVSRGQGRQTGLTQTAKSLLRNVIRHTDTHNRLKEESETWQQFYKMRGMDPPNEDLIDNEEDTDRSRHSRLRDDRRRKRDRDKSDVRGDADEGVKGDLDIQRSFLYDDRVDMYSQGLHRRGSRHAHMDDNVGGGDRSTYWMRQLHRVEEADPDRWGHGGFKELYPEDYNSERSRSCSSSSSDSNRRKKKRRKGDTSERKSKKRSKEKKKKKKKKRTHSSCEESSVEEEKVIHRKRKRRRKDKAVDRILKKKWKTIKKEHESANGGKHRPEEDRKNIKDLSEEEESENERRSWRHSNEDGGNTRVASSRESSHRKKKRRR